MKEPSKAYGVLNMATGKWATNSHGFFWNKEKAAKVAATRYYGGAKRDMVVIEVTFKVTGVTFTKDSKGIWRKQCAPIQKTT